MTSQRSGYHTPFLVGIIAGSSGFAQAGSASRLDFPMWRLTFAGVFMNLGPTIKREVTTDKGTILAGGGATITAIIATFNEVILGVAPTIRDPATDARVIVVLVSKGWLTTRRDVEVDAIARAGEFTRSETKVLAPHGSYVEAITRFAELDHAVAAVRFKVCGCVTITAGFQVYGRAHLAAARDEEEDCCRNYNVEFHSSLPKCDLFPSAVP